MANLIYDKLLSFGVATMAKDSVFPNVLDLGTGLDGKAGTKVDRMTCDILMTPDAAGGTGITAKVQGSNDKSTWVDLGTATFTAAQLKAGACQVAISPNDYRYIHVIFTKAGTYTAGTAECFLNTYAGK
jgi:hypothetical protein